MKTRHRFDKLPVRSTLSLVMTCGLFLSTGINHSDSKLDATFGLIPHAYAQGIKADKKPIESPLADVFAGNDGGAYYVTEVGSQVFWFAEHPGRGYAHIFLGKRDGNNISGSFWSVPKGKAMASGNLSLRINNNGTMKVIDSHKDFPSDSFSVTSIHGILDKLPGESKYPGFTANSLNDLDGMFKDTNNYTYYVRQQGDKVVFFAEKDFKKGERPDRAYVFIGKMHSNKILGQIVSLPKGEKKGHASTEMTLNQNRSLSLLKVPGWNGGTLNPFLPEIRVPIRQAMNALNSQLNKVELRLDGYDKDGKELKKGSFIKFDDKVYNFSIPYLEVRVGAGKNPVRRRTFINDMQSDIINVKSVSENETRLSLLFEASGKEIKRYEKFGLDYNDDSRLNDADIENPRVDVFFRLVNATDSNGRTTIGYQVTKVELPMKLDFKLLGDGVEEWIAKKIRPTLEAELKEFLNKAEFRKKFSDQVQDQLQKAEEYLSQYSLYGFSASALAPKQVAIDGNDVVFRF